MPVRRACKAQVWSPRVNPQSACCAWLNLDFNYACRFVESAFTLSLLMKKFIQSKVSPFLGQRCENGFLSDMV